MATDRFEGDLSLFFERSSPLLPSVLFASLSTRSGTRGWTPETCLPMSFYSKLRFPLRSPSRPKSWSRLSLSPRAYSIIATNRPISGNDPLNIVHSHIVRLRKESQHIRGNRFGGKFVSPVAGSTRNKTRNVTNRARNFRAGRITKCCVLSKRRRRTGEPARASDFSDSNGPPNTFTKTEHADAATETPGGRIIAINNSCTVHRLTAEPDN